MPLATRSHRGASSSLLGGDEARKDLEPALPDDVVVVAAAELHAAILHHAQPAPLATRTPG